MRHQQLDQNRIIRARAIEALGAVCSCCGLNDPDLLSIHHVLGDGGLHKAEVGGAGHQMYLDILRTGADPARFRVLCRNCHQGLHSNDGECPHVRPLEPVPDRMPCPRCGNSKTSQRGVCDACAEELRSEYGNLARVAHCVSCGAPTGKRVKGGTKYLCDECAAARDRLKQRMVRHRRRRRVLEHYSDGNLRCAHCGVDHYPFLSLDHVEGGGKKHHRQLSASGDAIETWLIRNDFPPGYQVLCCNCNWMKHVASATDDNAMED